MSYCHHPPRFQEAENAAMLFIVPAAPLRGTEGGKISYHNPQICLSNLQKDTENSFASNFKVQLIK